MTRTKQLNMRIDDATRARLERIGAHLGKAPGGVVRFLLWRADMEIAAGTTIVVPPDQYAREKMRVSDDGLRQLVAAGYVSNPPTRDEVDRWIGDPTLASPRDILARLARARGSRAKRLRIEDRSAPTLDEAALGTEDDGGASDEES